MCNIVLRLVLAFSMAIWSPAWCCCAVRAAAGGGEATLAAACASRSVMQASPTPVRPCCAAASNCDGDDDDVPCRCSDRDQDMNRLDTSSAPAGPKLSLLHVASVADVCGIGLSQPGRMDVSWRNARVHRPPTSLLAQRCRIQI